MTQLSDMPDAVESAHQRKTPAHVRRPRHKPGASRPGQVPMSVRTSAPRAAKRYLVVGGLRRAASIATSATALLLILGCGRQSGFRLPHSFPAAILGQPSVLHSQRAQRHVQRRRARPVSVLHREGRAHNDSGSR